MITRNQRMLAVLLTLVLLLACAPVLAPAAPPTLDPGSVNTVVALTAGAAATQTARNLSPTSTITSTPLPTKTSTEVPTATPTFLFLLSTYTLTPTETPTKVVTTVGCEIISRSPGNKAGFAPGDSFDGHWVVKNTGTNTWDENSVDYRYVRGDKFHDAAAYDLPNSVDPGEQIDLIVDMTAPDEPDTYTTTWQVREGKTVLCTMSLTIVVN